MAKFKASIPKFDFFNEKTEMTYFSKRKVTLCREVGKRKSFTSHVRLYARIARGNYGEMQTHQEPIRTREVLCNE